MTLIFNLVAGVVCSVLINYFSDTLPVSQRFAMPKCTACGQFFTVKDYLFSLKCSGCGHKKPARHYIVLFSTVIICALLNYFPFSHFSIWTTLPFVIYFGVVLVIDIEHRLILIETSLIGFILLLIYGIFLRGLPNSLFGALGGLVITLLFYLLGLAFNAVLGGIRNQKIEEVAFGFGDVSMGIVLGLLTGWPGIIGTMIIAILAFGAFSLIFILTLIVLKRYHAFASPLPFAPFLILGTIVMFYI